MRRARPSEDLRRDDDELPVDEAVRRLGGLGGWMVEGELHGRAVTAWWDRSQRSFASDDAEVVQRAEAVVAAGETFRHDRRIAASLDDCVPAALAALRAMDDVRVVLLCVPSRLDDAADLDGGRY